MTDDTVDCERIVRPIASNRVNVLFTIRDLIVAAAGEECLDAFREFLRSTPVGEILSVTDYCFHDDYPNDVIVYSVVKGGELLPTAEELAALKADLKNVRELDSTAIKFLRDPRIFTFVVVLEKKAKIHRTRELMLEVMDASIAMQSTWVNAESHREGIDRLKALRREAESAGFNQLLYDRMLLASAIAAVVSTLILDYSPIEIAALGWFSDRDAIVEKGAPLASYLYAVALNDCCTDANLPYPSTLGVIDHSNPSAAGKDAWFDPITRIADYFAGPLAKIDYDAIVPREPIDVPSQKHRELFSGVFADNPNVVVIRLSRKLPSLSASRIDFSKTSPQVEEASTSNNQAPS